jgi:3-hydroxyacyl-[acyl-carrier-protein] dehydratase
MKTDEIKQKLPHREPFLLLDEITIDKEGGSARAVKTLTGSEYFFEGHFPNRPVMPGVLIVEAMSQASMVLMGTGDYVIKTVSNIKFRRTIEPGDILDISVEKTAGDGDHPEFSCKVNVDGELAASGSLGLEKRTGTD